MRSESGGLTRQQPAQHALEASQQKEVMDSMLGKGSSWVIAPFCPLRANSQQLYCSTHAACTLPSAAPAYDMTATAAATQQQQQQQSGAAVVAVSSTDRAWQEITVPEGLGLAATRFKWRQNLSHVEVFVRLPGSVQPKQVGSYYENL